MSNLHCNILRVKQRLDALYACGEQSDGSHTRMAFSHEDQKGRRLFQSWFHELGIKTKTDAAGNLIAKMPGKNNNLPSIILGSHLDTVPDGGKYDGALGCVAGLEVCQKLSENGLVTDHPIEVIVFSDEEGFRFSEGLAGSSAFCGKQLKLSPDDLDFSGLRREAVYQDAGISLAEIHEAERKRESVHCCLELHIEQGSSLYLKQLPLGIVSTIAGVQRTEVRIKGEANHSGSTRMSERKDALVAASSLIASIPERVLKLGNEYTVATVGTIKVEPSAVNVIPGECTFSLEVRDQNETVIQNLISDIRLEINRMAQSGRFETDWREISYHKPMPMNEELRQVILSCARFMSLPHEVIPSGAFHDSLLLAEHFPTAMIFVASVEGKSHCKEEYSEPENIEKGIDLLLATVIAADQKEFSM